MQWHLFSNSYLWSSKTEFVALVLFMTVIEVVALNMAAMNSHNLTICDYKR